MTEVNAVPPTTIQGLRYSRWAGVAAALVLMVWGLTYASQAHGAASDLLRVTLVGIWCVAAVLLALPWQRLQASPLWWKRLFVLLFLCTMAFSFSMVIKIIYDYMAADQMQERLKVPGLEGTLIFVVLIQLPTIWFQRRPDLLH